jgi:hypothetical protein
MPLKFEELEVLHKAENIADRIWKDVVRWKPFGRFHYGEKLQFLYYARGILYETKYWFNRAIARELIPLSTGQSYTSDLTELARQLNASLATLKNIRRDYQTKSSKIGESESDYNSITINHEPTSWYPMRSWIGSNL